MRVLVRVVFWVVQSHAGADGDEEESYGGNEERPLTHIEDNPPHRRCQCGPKKTGFVTISRVLASSRKDY